MKKKNSASNLTLYELYYRLMFIPIASVIVYGIAYCYVVGSGHNNFLVTVLLLFVFLTITMKKLTK